MKRAFISALLLVTLLLQCSALVSCGLSGPYTVTFDCNGGSPVPEAVVVNKGERLECPPEPERKGYEFVGWYYKDRVWDFEKDVVKRNMALSARWRQYGHGDNPNLIEKDWEGAEFTVLTREDGIESKAFNIVDVTFGDADSLSDPVSKAVYERNETIKSVYNAKVVRKAVSDSNYDAALADVQANGCEYSAYMVSVAEALPLALSGNILDFNSEVSYINLKEEWWDTAAIESIAVNNRAYYALGDINVVDDYATYCVFYNRWLANKGGVPYLYDEVKNGNWTIDNMKKWATAFAADANGDGEWYGLIYEDDFASALLQAGGESPFKMEKNGRLSSRIESEGLKNAIGIIRDGFMLDCAENDAWALNVSRERLDENEARGYFAANRTLFYVSYCGNNARLCREMAADLGMLPLPKLSEGQAEYGSAIRYADATCYVVPYSVADSEFSGFMLEALCYYSSHEYSYNSGLNYVDANRDTAFFHKIDHGFNEIGYFEDNTMKAGLYAKLMQMRGANDDDRKEMLDIIFRNRVFDIACMGDVGGINALLARSASSNAPEDEWWALMETYSEEIERAVADCQDKLLRGGIG